MDIGFIGLGNMGFPMARRLIEAGNRLVVFDTRQEVVDKLVARGATAATSPKQVADQVETVMASLPSLQASLAVATGPNGVIEGSSVKRFIDLSTVGSAMAVKIHGLLAKHGSDPHTEARLHAVAVGHGGEGRFRVLGHGAIPLAFNALASACTAREQCVLTLPSEHPMTEAVSATSSSSQ